MGRGDVKADVTYEKTERLNVSVSNNDEECFEDEHTTGTTNKKMSKKAFAPFFVWVIVTIIFVVIGIIWALYMRDSQIWRNWGLNPLFASLCWILLFIIVSALLLLLGAWGKTGLAWVVLIIAIFLPILLWIFAVSGRNYDAVKTTTVRGPAGREFTRTVATNDGNVIQETTLSGLSGSASRVRGAF